MYHLTASGGAELPFRRVQYRDWEKAFFDVIPRRKFDDKSRKQKRKEAREKAGVEGGQTPEELQSEQQKDDEGEMSGEGIEAEARNEEPAVDGDARSAQAASADASPQATIPVEQIADTSAVTESQQTAL